MYNIYMYRVHCTYKYIQISPNPPLPACLHDFIVYYLLNNSIKIQNRVYEHIA